MNDQKSDFKHAESGYKWIQELDINRLHDEYDIRHDFDPVLMLVSSLFNIEIVYRVEAWGTATTTYKPINCSDELWISLQPRSKKKKKRCTKPLAILLYSGTEHMSANESSAY
jgi:hypothetical protein